MLATKQSKVKKNPIKDRINAAKDPSATTQTLMAALNDDSVKVRCTAASNPSANEEVLLAALRDWEYQVRICAAKNPSATPKVLLHAINDRDYEVRLAVPSNPSATIDILFNILRYNYEWDEDENLDPSLIIAAVKNPNSTTEFIEEVVKEFSFNYNYEGYVAVLDSPKCTDKMVIDAIGFYDDDIAFHAIEKLKSKNIKLPIEKWIEIVSSSECLNGNERQIPSDVRKNLKYKSMIILNKVMERNVRRPLPACPYGRPSNP